MLQVLKYKDDCILIQKCGKIDYEIRRNKGLKNKPKPGKRATFLAQYKVVGYEKAKEIVNKDFESEVFSDEVLKKWIEEDER